ncbi:hypothetical protein TNCV_454461 [Trichonephila clavipes]|nr:hypothetical protein TNCV_454461 [Trichonephila clavipes]
MNHGHTRVRNLVLKISISLRSNDFESQQIEHVPHGESSGTRTRFYSLGRVHDHWLTADTYSKHCALQWFTELWPMLFLLSHEFKSWFTKESPCVRADVLTYRKSSKSSCERGGLETLLPRIKLKEYSIGRREFSQFLILSPTICQEDDVQHVSALYSDFEAWLENALPMIIPQQIKKSYGHIKENKCHITRPDWNMH